jgi:AraC-like DNA-binding protein
VWQGFVVLAIFFLVYAIYSLDAGELIYEFAMEVINIVLICYLLWRVETLSDLSLPINDAEDLNVSDKRERGISPGEKYSLSKNIGSLLQQHCIDQQLYLQHDLTLLQLAKAIGTNRFYLSQYFSRQGITYNAYINDLRINHFMSLYREAAAAQKPISAQQLARESGYRSYSTFSLAFKQRTGQSVTAWMRNPQSHLGSQNLQ